MNDETTFPYSEKLAAEKLSVPRRDVRAQREGQLQRGVDWEKTAGEGVMLSETGLWKLFHLLGVDPATLDITTLEKNGAAEDASPSNLIVVAICPNPRMVLANEDGDPDYGDRKLVDVGRNKNFAIGDLLQVAAHETQHGVWQLVSRLPASTRRPESNESLRDPKADWGRSESEHIRKNGAEFRRRRAALKR